MYNRRLLSRKFAWWSTSHFHLQRGVDRDKESLLEVIGAALEMLAEDIEDVAVSKARANEPRVTLEELEAELRGADKLE